MVFLLFSFLEVFLEFCMCIYDDICELMKFLVLVRFRNFDIINYVIYLNISISFDEFMLYPIYEIFEIVYLGIYNYNENMIFHLEDVFSVSS